MTPSLPTALALSPVFNADDQKGFNEAYAASLPPDLTAFMALPYNAFDAGSATAPTRMTLSLLLAIAAKYALDTQIALFGYDPYMTMLMRLVQGYPWVPSFGQPNIPIGPGLSMPQIPYTYNPAAPPPGSIIMPLVNPATGKMTLPLAFVAPVIIAPVTTTDPVGFLEFPFGAPNGIGDWYSLTPGDTSPLGTISVSINPPGTFKKETQGFANLAEPGQLSVFWVKISA
jgi:hypothetical protein